MAQTLLFNRVEQSMIVMQGGYHETENFASGDYFYIHFFWILSTENCLC